MIRLHDLTLFYVFDDICSVKFAQWVRVIGYSTQRLYRQLIEICNKLFLFISYNYSLSLTKLRVFLSLSADDIEISKRLSPKSRSVIEEFLKQNEYHAFIFMK